MRGRAATFRSGSDFMRLSLYRARRGHLCDWCHGPILPGARYLYAFGVVEGVRSAYRHCERCSTEHDQNELSRAWMALSKETA